MQDTLLISEEKPNEESLLESLLAKIENELTEVARRTTKSVLCERNFTGLSNLDFGEIVNEIRTLCPLVYKFLAVMMQLDVNTKKKTAPMALIYSLIMFRRCHELSRLQRINSVLLYEGDANQEVSVLDSAMSFSKI